MSSSSFDRACIRYVSWSAVRNRTLLLRIYHILKKSQRLTVSESDTSILNRGALIRGLLVLRANEKRSERQRRTLITTCMGQTSYLARRKGYICPSVHNKNTSPKTGMTRISHIYCNLYDELSVMLLEYTTHWLHRNDLYLLLASWGAYKTNIHRVST